MAGTSSDEYPSRLMHRAHASIMVMARVVSTAVMATVIFVAGIFIGRATVPALFEKDRTEQLLARIAHAVQERKQLLDQLRLKTPVPQVHYPDEFRKDDPQGFTPEAKPTSVPPPPPSVASNAPVKSEKSVPPQPSEGIAIANAGPKKQPDPAKGSSVDVGSGEKTARTPQTSVSNTSSDTAKPERASEPMKPQPPVSVPGSAAKPPEHAAPASNRPVGTSAGGGSLKAMLYSGKSAEMLAASLRKRGLTPVVQPRMTSKGVRYEVMVTGIGSQADVKDLAKTIQQTHAEAEIVAGP